MKTQGLVASTAIYWVTTLLFSLAMAASAVGYLTSDQMARAFVHLGFPAYFRIELAVAKLLGVAVLLAPAVPQRVKEWAYAGFTITLISAIVAHSSVDGPQAAAAPLTFLWILIASYLANYRLNARRTAAPAAPDVPVGPAPIRAL